jgi:hypothetical protein
MSGLSAPVTPTLKIGSTRYSLIETTDMIKGRIFKSKAAITAVNTAFPTPLRFRQVWHFARGAKSLFAWKAQPPEGFIAMGMICTTTGNKKSCISSITSLTDTNVIIIIWLLFQILHQI